MGIHTIPYTNDQIDKAMGNALDSPRGFTVVVGRSGNVDYLCDGAADDVQIQAAIDAVSAAGGGTVLFRSGEYVANSTIYAKSNVDWLGEGNVTIKLTDGADVNLINNYNFGTDVIENLIIQNITFDGNHSNQTDTDIVTIFFSYPHNVKIFNCTFNNTMHGSIVFQHDNAATVLDHAPRYCEIAGNTFNATSVISDADHVRLVGFGSSIAMYNNIHDNLLFDAKNDCIHLYRKADYNLVHGNIIIYTYSNDTTTGIKLGQTNNAGDSKYNIVYGNSVIAEPGYYVGAGISMFANCPDNIISNNIISRARHCIDVRDGAVNGGNIDRCQFLGNSFINPTEATFYIEGSAEGIIVDSNSVYGSEIFNTISPTDSVNGAIISNNIMHTVSASAINLSNASSSEKLKIINNTVRNETDFVVLIRGGGSFSNIRGNLIINTGSNCTGVRLRENSADCIISGNIIHHSVGSSMTGIAEQTGCDYNVVSNNNLRSATTKIVKFGDNTIIQNNIGYNPVGNFTAPVIPASTTPYTNAYGYPCMVSVYGGTVTDIAIDAVSTGQTSGVFTVPPGETITLTYSVAPAWTWTGL